MSRQGSRSLRLCRRRRSPAATRVLGHGVPQPTLTPCSNSSCETISRSGSQATSRMGVTRGPQPAPLIQGPDLGSDPKPSSPTNPISGAQGLGRVRFVCRLGPSLSRARSLSLSRSPSSIYLSRSLSVSLCLFRFVCRLGPDLPAGQSSCSGGGSWLFVCGTHFRRIRDHGCCACAGWLYVSISLSLLSVTLTSFLSPFLLPPSLPPSLPVSHPTTLSPPPPPPSLSLRLFLSCVDCRCSQPYTQTACP